MCKRQTAEISGAYKRKLKMNTVKNKLNKISNFEDTFIEDLFFSTCKDIY